LKPYDARIALWRLTHPQELPPVIVFVVATGLRRAHHHHELAGPDVDVDAAKGFDHSAPISELVPVAQAGELAGRTLTLRVNGEVRQHGSLHDLIWDVADILHELSKLYALKAGDLVYMGTPVAPALVSSAASVSSARLRAAASWIITAATTLEPRTCMGRASGSR